MYFVGSAEPGQEVFIGRLAPTGRPVMGCLGICGSPITVLFVGGRLEVRPHEIVTFVPEAFSGVGASFAPVCGARLTHMIYQFAMISVVCVKPKMSSGHDHRVGNGLRNWGCEFTSSKTGTSL